MGRSNLYFLRKKDNLVIRLLVVIQLLLNLILILLLKLFLNQSHTKEKLLLHPNISTLLPWKLICLKKIWLLNRIFIKFRNWIIGRRKKMLQYYLRMRGTLSKINFISFSNGKVHFLGIVSKNYKASINFNQNTIQKEAPSIVTK